LISFLALLCNYDRENCLINLGTEGRFNLTIETPVEGATVLGPDIDVQVTSQAVILTGEGIEETFPVHSLTLTMTDVDPVKFNNVSGARHTFKISIGGPKTITATARFDLKEKSATRNFTLSIETTAPAINITTPTNNQIIGDSGPTFAVPVEVNASDPSGVGIVRFRVGDVQQAQAEFSDLPTEVTVDRQLTLPRLGEHVIAVSVTDRFGNTGEVSVRVSTADMEH
jgi:hypothetical protein